MTRAQAIAQIQLNWWTKELVRLHQLPPHPYVSEDIDEARQRVAALSREVAA